MNRRKRRMLRGFAGQLHQAANKLQDIARTGVRGASRPHHIAAAEALIDCGVASFQGAAEALRSGEPSERDLKAAEALAAVADSWRSAGPSRASEERGQAVRDVSPV